MATSITTEHLHTGNGSTTDYSVTFSYLKEADVKVTLDHVATTAYTFQNATTIRFNTAPANGVRIHIFRDTDVDAARFVFASGSALKANEINENLEQLLMADQEPAQEAGLSDQAVSTAKLRDGAVTTAKIANGAIGAAQLGSGAIITTTVSNGAITTAKLADSSVTSAKIADGGIAAVDLATDSVTTGKIEDAAVTEAKIANGAVTTNKIADNNVTTAKILDANVTTAKIADANVTTAKVADSAVTTAKIAGDAVTSAKLADGAVTSSKILDGTISTVDIGDNQVSTVKLANGAVTEAKLGNDAVTNSKIAASAVTATELANNAVTNAKIANDAVTADKINNGEITVAKMNGAAVVTNSEQAASTPNDTSFFTTSASDGRYFRQDSTETITSGVTWSGNDTKIATTGAIDARIIDLLDDVGGFTPIANETSFPATNPQGNTGTTQLVSIKTLSADLTPSSGTITIANGAGTGNTVTITNAGSAVLPAGFGVIVETTNTLHQYNFHRLQPKATEVTTVATNITNVAAAGANVADINNFADRYRVSASDPTARADGSSLQEGDLYYNTAQDVMKAYNGSSYDKITPDSSQLNDIAVVANDISTTSDLGSIADALVAGGSGGAVEVVSDTLEGAETKVVTVASGVFVVDGTSNPVLELRKGWTYTFDQSDASNSNHPFAFKSGTSAYTTGVTVTGTAGSTGAKVVFKVPDSATNLRYYCTVHGNGMGNTITVIEDPITAVANADAAITTVNSNATNINLVAGSIANVNTVGGSIGDVNRYAQEYVIQSSTPSSPSAGDLWYNTTANTLNYYSGSGFIGIAPGIASVSADTQPQLGGTLNADNNNMTNVGTIDGSNLSLDFGTL